MAEAERKGRLRLNIGCGGAWSAPGWLGVDQSATASVWQPVADGKFLEADLRSPLPFADASAEVIFSSHTLEHFTYSEGVVLLHEFHRILEVGAPLCLVVPDLNLYLRALVSRDEVFLNVPEIIGGVPRDNLTDNFLMNFYSDPSFNNSCHKYAYNIENISSILGSVGFVEIEQRPFHDFSYWPELKKARFKSPIHHVEAFSLCVQCRRSSAVVDYESAPLLLAARRAASVGRERAALEQALAAALVVNKGLEARLQRLEALIAGIASPVD